MEIKFCINPTILKFQRLKKLLLLEDTVSAINILPSIK